MSVDTHASTRDASRGGGPPVPHARNNLCAFWLGEHCYGVETAFVGEVVEIDAIAPVPLAPAPVRGLFSLRGTPVALIDLARMLELPEPPMLEEPRPGHPLTALVLRTDSLLVGVLVRRVEMVITRGRGVWSAPQRTIDEHAAVSGFLELPDRHLTVTILDPDAILARIEQLKYLDSTADRHQAEPPKQTLSSTLVTQGKGP